MDMKQQIMEKLFAEKPLSNEEILYVGANLGTNKGGDFTISTLPAYNHSSSSLVDACGLTDDDFESVNSLIKSEIMARKDELDTCSKEVEVYEKIGMTKPAHFRMLMYQFVKMKSTLKKKNNGPSIKLGGGNLDDFLDFLKGKL